MRDAARFITRLLGSRRFFYGVLIFFGLESLWIAISAAYPMAFDEDFHFGLIKIYSHHWLPFLSGQPDGADAFGAVARDPSYLYHYLMSFPYRLISFCTGNETARVVFLRLLNIMLFGTALVLFRRVLRRAGTSAPLANLALALFVLIPIAPLLAGQINYDNLLLPLLAWVCLLVYQLTTELQRRQIRIKTFVRLASVALLASLVTHVFLPVLLVVGVYVVVRLLQAFWRRGRELRRKIRLNYATLSTGAKVGLLILLTVSLGLFLQRDGVNLLHYGTPVPDCDQVVDSGVCQSYGPWQRNEMFAGQKVDDQLDGPLGYTRTWLTSLHFRSFFVVSGPDNGYTNYPPLPLPSATALVIGLSGLVALLLYWRRVFASRPYLVFLFAAVVGYCVMLWAEDYSQYHYTGQPVAINGRYMLLVLLPLTAVLARAFSIAFRPIERIKPFLAALALLLFLQGGGVLSFISRSDSTWDWPAPWVVHMNNGARRVLAPVLIESDKHY